MTAPHCICLYIHTYIYKHIHIYMYIYTHIYIYICTDERVSLFIECNNQRTHFILALSFICKMSSHENMYSDGHSIYHDIRYGAVMIAAERNSYFELKTDIPYLALTGELWGVYYVNCEENWPRHDGTALHMHIYTHIHINTYTYICTYTHIHIYIYIYAQMSECVFSLNAIINVRILYLLFHSYARCPHTKTCIQMGTA